MADFTTVQVSELPPLAPTIESLLAHQIGDVLYKMTLPELLTLISIQSSARKYEIKQVRAPNAAYISDNFDMTIGATQGIGKPTGLWAGWAICNGNNGTDNLDGQALIGYGAIYETVGQFVGEKEHVLTVPEMPAHSHLNGITDGQQRIFVYGGTKEGMPGLATSGVDDYVEARTYQGRTSSIGGGAPFSVIQPSMVILTIMKI